MTDLYLCRHCDKEVGTPKPFAMVVDCPSCKMITPASVALALGALKQAGPANPVETPGVSMPSEVDRLRGTNASLERQLEKAIAQLNELEADNRRLVENNGAMEQELSDRNFHMGRLFKRLCEKLGIDDSTNTWFDIADKVDQVVDRLAVVEKEWSDEAAEHRTTQVSRDTWRSKYHEIAEERARLHKALKAMLFAFDVGQAATPTSAIGQARAAFEIKP